MMAGLLFSVVTSGNTRIGDTDGTRRYQLCRRIALNKARSDAGLICAFNRSYSSLVTPRYARGVIAPGMKVFIDNFLRCV